MPILYIGKRQIKNGGNHIFGDGLKCLYEVDYSHKNSPLPYYFPSLSANEFIMQGNKLNFPKEGEREAVSLAKTSCFSLWVDFFS